jgi:hypothetical protein
MKKIFFLFLINTVCNMGLFAQNCTTPPTCRFTYTIDPNCGAPPPGGSTNCVMPEPYRTVSFFYIFGSPIVGALPKQQESKLSVKVNIINFKNVVDENNYTNINHVHIG